MAFTYEFLTHPLPEAFLAWYPYDKPGGSAEPSYPDWLRGMRRVTGNTLPGLKHTFVVARASAAGDYAGVCWLCESEATPELAHFGWFLTEPAYRGQGAGRGILDGAIEHLESHGVEMIMLPTQTTTVHARGMYARRGFKDFLAETGSTGCWMVRAPEGHYERYFTHTADVQIDAFAPCDYIALDYLVNGAAGKSRLYTMGLIGTKRIVSFKPTWQDAIELLAAREGGRLLGVAALDKEGHATEFDFCAHDHAAARALVGHVVRSHASASLRCHVARADEGKRAMVEAAGLAVVGSDTARAPGGDMVEFDVLATEA